LSLLCKWWWYLENGSGLWQDIVRLKYVKGSPTYLIPNRYNDSPIWSDLLKIRPHQPGSPVTGSIIRLVAYFPHGSVLLAL
jgi:hypothetical protein